MEWIKKAGCEAAAILLHLIYPGRCPICHGIVGERRLSAHPECVGRLTLIREPACKKCGKALEREEQEYCADCTRREHAFDRGYGVFCYDDRISGSIYRFKYHNKREYARFYGEAMAHSLGERILRWRPDGIVPVPLHPARRRKRGFNQAQLLAERLGAELGIPVYRDLVKRIRNTAPQKELNQLERQNNLKKAFKIVKNDVKLYTVVILDDIYTTGSTADAIAAVLKQAGVHKVYCISLAIGREK